MIRLSDLQPGWTAPSAGWCAPSYRDGLTFLCPCCLKTRLGILFEPPIDPDGLREKFQLGDLHIGEKVWRRERGETFDDLTLSPSIDCSESGHWHGHICTGECT